jgi:hypothetical protein
VAREVRRALRQEHHQLLSHDDGNQYRCRHRQTIREARLPPYLGRPSRRTPETRAKRFRQQSRPCNGRQMRVHPGDWHLQRVKLGVGGHVQKSKSRHSRYWAACLDKTASYAAVFLAGSFSLIRADLPLRSRR